ncbi:putative transcriptional regulatory protein PB1A11.04c [Tolypocladium ophioglossoides CBS 100239]|uniref:Putative transcriptional regulatory protein PB1A11.04c n=1 Tax=Tolypocladium ophioglossoides (strain CBS 100239) TaxID=1163406 RepID=A0A0L0NI63_TOLOC|nr:putative transcriptional regulatory protein PB1A11.04c [Tolypocladium ophioglossoides CBS 100239]
MDLDSESPPDIAFDSQGHSRAQSHLYRNHQDHHNAARADGHRPKKSPSTCSTCRMRKVRCNGAHPLCSNCQRLGFPCSYDDAEAEAWSMALPRRRVRQACLSCHSRKARCSGHLPACERCRAQGLECVYRPSKRVRTSARGSYGDVKSPQSHEGGDKDRGRDDGHNDSDAALTDHPGTATPSTFNYDVACPDESFEALIGRTLDQFFRHVHHIPMYSFLHRASLMEQYNAGKVDKALLLALVGITSCLIDMGPGVRKYGDRCIDNAEALIFADYTRPSAFKVQALVFMIKHRILSNKFSSAFVLFSIASRFAAALRLNYDSPNLCFLAQESRRRLMWSLFCIDSGISSGFRDFSLWRADKIHVSLPCNERNFEFDLPQPTEKLVPDSDEPLPPHPEDVGSIALHIRIFHIRQKIIEFTKNAVVSRNINTTDMQTTVLSLHRELDDFANRLPASFQFSENSLRLRGYSPRICVFVMIHVWWRQCHCDLYRIALAGFRDALPRTILETLDDSFIQHCQRQCLDHSLEMVSIFSAMQKLGAKPVADLDLALCAYQCARMLKYAYHVNGDKFGLTAEGVTEKGKVCLRTIQQCCMGSAAAAIVSELERLISRGFGAPSSPSQIASPDTFRLNGQVSSRHPVLRSIEVSDDPDVVSATNSTFTSAPSVKMNRISLPSAMMTEPWPSENNFADVAQAMPDVPEPRSKSTALEVSARAEFAPSELNNAYEGALDGLGLDNGLDHAMGMDLAPWPPSGEWVWPEFLNGGVGV